MDNNKEKQSIFLNIKKDFKLQLLICVFLCIVVIIVFLIVNNIVERKNYHEYKIEDDLNLINSIENITTENEKIKVEGYAFISDRNSSNDLISVFLQNVATGKDVWFDMEQTDRPDVNAYFAGEYDYKNTGFIASTDSKNIDGKEVYEIIINIDNVHTKDGNRKDIRKTVSTGRYILNGELYSYNPIDFDKPDMDIESELLREVFANGQLCLYQKEEGMYVYQYEGKLYWIATEDFNFEESGATYIIYHLFTSHIAKLPEHRIQNRFDNLDFNFEDREYKKEITEPYRVAISDIPKEYPITYILTGVYDIEIKKSYWTKAFKLDLDFN